MSTIYNHAYKVPVWVIVNLKPDQKNHREAIQEYLLGNGAILVGWPSDTFGATVKKMANRGWAHAIKEPPYTLDSTFATVAMAEHVNTFFGPNKFLNLKRDKPWYHTVNRDIKTEDDYRVLFNDIIYLQDSITLSHLFDIGEKCHNGTRRTKVFFSFGDIHTMLLQPVSDSVIVVSATGTISSAGTPEETVDLLDAKLDSLLMVK